MKTLKITLLLALFLMVSSQTYKANTSLEAAKKADVQETTKTYYDLLAHTRDKVVLPTQG
ncbi:hypothetical protein [Gelidibacter mesophilus]|uniref:hypothetical protein n=1 Tax=Gelidibacter mesophilus TaxID=169050 RepID=UPI0004109413|nr:hypothetical protein [Gelidibacter mesophilus]